MFGRRSGSGAGYIRGYVHSFLKVYVGNSRMMSVEREGESVCDVQMDVRILKWLKNLHTLK